MSKTPKHYGWLVSPYSAKTRSYLRFSGLSFEDIAPSAMRLRRHVQRAVGRLIMPTVELPDGRWLQDSSVIIDHFDALEETPSITPACPTQRFASSLLEVFADEWMPMVALHYRWNTRVNATFALDEFAANAFPLLPRVMGRQLIAPMANKMKSYLPVLGVDDAMQVAVEGLAQRVIRALDAQLADTRYLLGDRPAMADFALFGPLWAHLYRDPGSTALFDPYPNLRRWMSMLVEGASVEGEFLEEGVVPVALDPLFQCVFDGQWAWIRTLVNAIDAYCDAHPDARRVPRALGDADFELGAHHGTRRLVTFVQFKAQRAEVHYRRAPERIEPWMQRVLGRADVSSVIPEIRHPFVLKDYKPVLASSA